MGCAAIESSRRQSIRAPTEDRPNLSLLGRPCHEGYPTLGALPRFGRSTPFAG